MSEGSPEHYPRIKYVSSLSELLDARFEDECNALCWPRTLPGDFDELARVLHQSLGDESGLVPIDALMLSRLQLSAAGSSALRAISGDLDALTERGLEPELNLVSEYARAEPSAVLATDVYSFHADRAPVEVDTWLCTYHGPATEGLRNDQAVPRVQIPETRAELLRHFGGDDDEAFDAFLRDNSYDLHFAPTGGAVPWSFGVGCLWRVAVMWPGCLVPPCIHRAPPAAGQAPRLLLIG